MSYTSSLKLVSCLDVSFGTFVWILRSDISLGYFVWIFGLERLFGYLVSINCLDVASVSFVLVSVWILSLDSAFGYFIWIFCLDLSFDSFIWNFRVGVCSGALRWGPQARDPNNVF